MTGSRIPCCGSGLGQPSSALERECWLGRALDSDNFERQPELAQLRLWQRVRELVTVLTLVRDVGVANPDLSPITETGHRARVGSVRGESLHVEWRPEIVRDDPFVPMPTVVPKVLIDVLGDPQPVNTGRADHDRLGIKAFWIISGTNQTGQPEQARPADRLAIRLRRAWATPSGLIDGRLTDRRRGVGFGAVGAARSHDRPTPGRSDRWH